MKIGVGSKVTVEYSIFHQNLTGGHDSLKSFRVSFEVGKGEVAPVIENSVLGRMPGESLKVEIKGSDIFGAYDENKVIPIPFDKLDVNGPLSAGDFFHYRDKENRIHPFRVKKVENNLVWADFNHPLQNETFILNLLIEKVD